MYYFSTLTMFPYSALFIIILATLTDARFGHVNVKFDLRHVVLERLNGTNEQKLKLLISPSTNPLSTNGLVELARFHMKGTSGIMTMLMKPTRTKATVNITRRQAIFNTTFTVTKPDQKICLQLRLQSQIRKTLIATSTLCDYVSKWLFKPGASSLQFRMHAVATNFTSAVTKNAYYIMMMATMKMSCTTDYFGCDCSRYCMAQNNTYCDTMGRRKCLFGFYPNEGVDCLIDRNGTDILTMTSIGRACSIECRMSRDNILQCDQCGNVAQCYLGYEPDSKRAMCKEKICKNGSCVSGTHCSSKSVPDIDTGGFYSCVANETSVSTTYYFNITRKLPETQSSSTESSLRPFTAFVNETTLTHNNETLYETQKSSPTTRKICIIVSILLLVLCLVSVTIWKMCNVFIKKPALTEDKLVVKAHSVQDFEASCSIENPNFTDNAYRG